MSAYSPRPFTISAEDENGLRSATRRQAASAMCLADDWAEEGCTNVLVTCPDNIAHSRPQFRATLPLIRAALARRRNGF